MNHRFKHDGAIRAESAGNPVSNATRANAAFAESETSQPLLPQAGRRGVNSQRMEAMAAIFLLA
jgi:hypothetical protein